MDTPGCALSDLNSLCDDTLRCVCSAGYIEEFAVCKGEYIGPPNLTSM